MSGQCAITKIVMYRVIRIFMVGLTLLVTAATGCVSAATMEQARAQCKKQVTPAVTACVRRKMVANQDRRPEKYIPGCKAQMTAPFMACITKLIGATGFKNNNPLDAATEPDLNTARLAATAGQERVVPPRTIADITAILDQEKPNPARLGKLRAAADASEPAKSDPGGAGAFLFRSRCCPLRAGPIPRGGSRLRTRVAARERPRSISYVISRFRATMGSQHLSAGEPRKALALFVKLTEDGERSAEKGFLFTGYRELASINLLLGDFEGAQSYVQKLQTLWKRAASVSGYPNHAKSWESGVEYSKGELSEARGQLDDALRTYQRAEALRRQGIRVVRDRR